MARECVNKVLPRKKSNCRNFITVLGCDVSLLLKLRGSPNEW